MTLSPVSAAPGQPAHAPARWMCTSSPSKRTRYISPPSVLTERREDLAADLRDLLLHALVHASPLVHVTLHARARGARDGKRLSHLPAGALYCQAGRGRASDARHDEEANVARYRLRFLLQEFDLPRGITVIGRSLDCNLTIEDPLVSRQHARIVVDDDGGTRRGHGQPQRRARQRRAHPWRRRRSATAIACASARRTSSSAASTRRQGPLEDDRRPAPLRQVPPAVPARDGRLPQLRGDRADRRGDAQRQLRQREPDRVERAAPRRGARARADARARRPTPSGSSAAPRRRSRSSSWRAGRSTRRRSRRSRCRPRRPRWRPTTPPGSLWVIDIYRRTDRVPPVEVVERVGEAAAKHAGVVRGALGVAARAPRRRRRAAPRRTTSSAIARLEQMRRVLEPEEAAGPSRDRGDGRMATDHPEACIGAQAEGKALA